MANFVKKMQRKKSLRINIIFSAIYQFIKIIVPFITAPYISRVLGVTYVGEYSYASSIIFYFTAVASFGFNTYGNYEISKYRDDKEKVKNIFWNVFNAQFIFSSLSLMILLSLTYFGVLSSANRLLYFVMSLSVVAIAFDTSFYYQGNEEYVALAVRDTIVKIISTVFIFIFVKSQAYSDFLIYAGIISGNAVVCSFVVFFPSLRKVGFIDLKKINIIKPIYGGLVFFIATIFSSVYLQLNKTFIGIFSTTQENGYYEQAMKVAQMVISVLASLGSIMISRESYLFAHNEPKEAKRILYKALNLLILLSLPCIAGILVTSKYLVPMFFGQDFAPSAKVLDVLTIFAVVNPFSQLIINAYMIPIKKRSVANWMTIFVAALDVVIAIPLTKYYGAVGAATALAVVQVVLFLLLAKYSNKFIEWKKVFARYLPKPLDATLIMVIVVIGLMSLFGTFLVSMIIFILAAIVVYFGLLILFREDMVISYSKLVINKLRKSVRKLIKK